MKRIERNKTLWIRIGCCLILCLACLGILHGLGLLQPIVNEDDDRKNQIENTGHVGEITQETTIQQTFRVEEDSLASVGVKIATFASLRDSLLFVSLEDAATHEVIQEWSIEMKNYSDNSLLVLFLDQPLNNAKGRALSLTIASNATMENAITLWTTQPSYYEGSLSINGRQQEDQLILLSNVQAAVSYAGYIYSGFFLFVIFLFFSLWITPGTRKAIVQTVQRQSKEIGQHRQKLLYIVLAEGAVVLFAIALEWALPVLFHIESIGLAKQSRFVCVCAIGTLGIALGFGHPTLRHKPEYLVALMVFLMGTVYACSLPSEVFVSWDEAIHYSRTLALSNCMDGRMSLADQTLITSNGLTPDWYNMEILSQKQALFEQSWQTSGTTVVAGRNLEKLWTATYIPSALGITLGRIFQLPHRYLFLLGGYCNLLVYVAAVFFGMRKLKSGKMIIAVVALLPTPLFLAVRYGYDIWLISFYLLGTCYWIGNMQSCEPIRKKDALIAWGAFFVGSFAKSVYFPILAVLFLLPAQRMEDPRWALSYRCMILASMVTLAAGMVLGVMVLPFIWVASYGLAKGIGWLGQKMSRKTQIIIASVVLLVGAAVILVLVYRVVPGMLGIGDLRGGAVNAGQQLLRILENPLAYLKILGEFLVTVYFSYSSSAGWISNVGSMAYLGTSSLRLLPVMLLVVVALTDKNEMDAYPRAGLAKGMSLILIVVTAAMIATTMYIDFTPLGYQTIQGCQPRYLLPFFSLFFMVIGSPKVHHNWDLKRYHATALTTSLFLAAWSISQLAIIHYC